MTSENHSLGQQVFLQIRDSILSGAYKKGEELRELTLAGTLGVSRTPVREALRQLEMEGLVSIIPNKGAVVVGFSAEDLHDIYELRSVLEGLCARRAALRATEEQLEKMEELMLLSDFQLQRGRYDLLVELDSGFHEQMYQASQSKIMAHVLSDYHHYVERVRRVTLAQPNRSAQSNEEHRQILQALKEKDATRAEELAHMHVMNTIHNIDACGLDELLEK